MLHSPYPLASPSAKTDLQTARDKRLSEDGFLKCCLSAVVVLIRRQSIDSNDARRELRDAFCVQAVCVTWTRMIIRGAMLKGFTENPPGCVPQHIPRRCTAYRCPSSSIRLFTPSVSEATTSPTVTRKGNLLQKSRSTFPKSLTASLEASGYVYIQQFHEVPVKSVRVHLCLRDELSRQSR